MSILIFNGSPRGKESNSSKITQWFLKSYSEGDINYLNKVNQHHTYIDNAKNFNQLMFVFPLYVDGMPAQVKCFFELMEKNKALFKGKEVMYIIHSGFSEAIHCKNLERYLNHFSSLMELDNKGVCIIPGSEGFRLMHPNMTKKKAQAVSALALDFKTHNKLNKKLLQKLAGPLVSPFPKIVLFKFLSLIGLINIYWNSQLKKNNAYNNRFAKPYSK